MANAFIYPVTQYLTITQGFKITGANIHRGLDFGWNSSAPGSQNQGICAAEGGTVVEAVDGYGNTYPNNRIYGNYIIISHNGFWSVYGHLLRGLRVKKGDRVKKGQIIAYMGNTGYSKGPHLHFEIRKGANDRAHVVDPLNYLMLENRAVIVSTASLYYDRIKYRGTTIGTPVPRDQNREQVEILITDLNVRTAASISADSLGFCTKGIYNINARQRAGDFEWYEIEPGRWIAFSEKWATYYPKAAPELWRVTFPPVTRGDYNKLLQLADEIGVRDRLTIEDIKQ